MRDLAKSGLARDVEVRYGWLGRRRRFSLPPPTIQEALELIVSRAGYVANVAADRQVYREAIMRWFLRADPSAGKWLARYADSLAEHAITLVFEGPQIKKRKRHPDEDVQMAPWKEMLAGVAAAFGSDPWAVYTTMGFTFFLLMLDEAGRVEAKAQLRAITAASLQHMEEDKQRTLLDELTATVEAGHPKLSDRERSRRAIKELERMRGKLDV